MLDSALINSTFYYIAEFDSPDLFDFTFVGVNLLDLNNSVNVTISTSKAGLDPFPVSAKASELFIGNSLTGVYVVTMLSGKIV